MAPATDGYLLGFDVGSSSITAAPRPGWAEQDPALWWQHAWRPRAAYRDAYGRWEQLLSRFDGTR